MFRMIFEKMAIYSGLILTKFRGIAIIELINDLTYLFHSRLNNNDTKMERNGELNVLKILSQTNPKYLFDVGANVGEWSLNASKICPEAKIHAFEIVPDTYDTLCQNTNQHKNIITNNYGLSDNKSLIVMNIADQSSIATAYSVVGTKFYENHYYNSLELPVIQGKEYIEGNDIDRIDLLKIDVEGMDLRVLNGFESKLHLIRVIQFEYGAFNVVSHDLLYDFFRMLTNEEYLIGKIFPKNVVFFEYEFTKENFFTSNYIAVKKNDREMISLLKRRTWTS